MKAALYRGTGPSTVLSVEEIATPEPRAGEVRVQVLFSGVNPTDWKSRAGATGSGPDGFQVPHHDGSGVVDAVGEGVTERVVGQRVWIYLAAFGNRYGTAAEYCVVPAVRTVPLPDSASDELGACLGVPALTAAHCLGGHPEALAGAHVLVAGGAGAVGHYAIELAKHAGAWVVTTVSSGAKAEMARAAGADLVVNYREPGATEVVKSFAPRMDRILELALGANLELDLAVAGPGTVIVVYASEAGDPVLPTRQFMNANVTLQYVLLYGVPAPEVAEAVTWTNGALATGALSELPLHLFPLDDVAAAQDAVEGGVVGKVLVVPHLHKQALLS
ncbi:MAG: NADPH:quinone reductase [Acidimicrobiales bacterium]